MLFPPEQPVSLMHGRGSSHWQGLAGNSQVEVVVSEIQVEGNARLSG
jgi:hypothetical protein